jgi:hypothetical protein
MLVSKILIHLVDWDITRKKLTHPDLFALREFSAMFDVQVEPRFFFEKACRSLG